MSLLVGWVCAGVAGGLGSPVVGRAQVRSNGSGSGVVAEVGVAERAGPDVLTGPGQLVAPPAPGLEPVVASAQRCEVAGESLM